MTETTMTTHKFVGYATADECTQSRPTGPFTDEPCGEGQQAPVHQVRPGNILAAAVALAAEYQATGEALGHVLAVLWLPPVPGATEALTAALEAAYGPDLVVAEREGLPGWLLVTPAEHCSCCGHRCGGGHVRGAACPCADRAVWDGVAR